MYNEMIKPKRFMIEYANYLIDRIERSKQAEEYRNLALRKISNTICDYQFLVLTVTDVMKELSYVDDATKSWGEIK